MARQEAYIAKVAAKERPLGDMHDFSTEEVQQLLHNKFVVILGDSIQRTIYKDLVFFLQNNRELDEEELKSRCQYTEYFLNDHLVEGGTVHRRTNYREVRQYRTDHHLVRVYFITRIYSDYMESILEDFRAGPTPDLLILNSCLWDHNRYLDPSSREPLLKAFREYRANLQTLFSKLHDILPTSCLIIWNTALPLGPNVKKGFLEPGMENQLTPANLLRANFESATLASCWQFDVLDLNFCFRFLGWHHAPDGIHWNKYVHRWITKLLLTHVAKAWGVNLEKKRPQNGIPWNGNTSQHRPPLFPPPPPLPPPPLCHPSPPPGYPVGLITPFNPSHHPNFQQDSIPDYGSCSGFCNFEDDGEQPAYPEATQYGGFHGPVDSGGHPFPVDQEPGGGQGVPWEVPFPSHMDYAPPFPRRPPRGFRGRHPNGRVRRHRRFCGEHHRPYAHRPNGAAGPPPFQWPPYDGRGGW